LWSISHQPPLLNLHFTITNTPFSLSLSLFLPTFHGGRTLHRRKLKALQSAATANPSPQTKPTTFLQPLNIFPSKHNPSASTAQKNEWLLRLCPHGGSQTEPPDQNKPRRTRSETWSCVYRNGREIGQKEVPEVHLPRGSCYVQLWGHLYGSLRRLLQILLANGGT